MSFRYMRTIVLFDLPTITYTERKEYVRFRRFLIKSGFFMLQQSVYCKIVLNASVLSSVVESVKKNKPNAGLVQMLSVTENQFSKMETITGEFHTDVIDTEERLIIL